MINPVLLRTFVCLAQTRHFTRTAEMLHMTQPGVSQHIRKLEDHFGLALLNRYGKRFELTEAGEALLHHGLAQEVAEKELLSALTGDLRHQGVCRLACSGALSMQIYPRLLDFQAVHRGLIMQVEAAPNRAIIERVKDGRSDLGLITHPISDAELSADFLGQDELCLLLPQDSAADFLTLQELGFINHPDGYHYAGQVLAANFGDAFRGMEAISQSGYVNQLGQILLPVSRGLGFTVLPRSALESSPLLKRVAVAQLDVSIHETIYMISKRHRPLPSRFEAILELLRTLWKDLDSRRGT